MLINEIIILSKEYPMSYDLIIKNGTVILENEAIKTDVAVKNGKIAAIGSGLSGAKEEINAEG